MHCHQRFRFDGKLVNLGSFYVDIKLTVAFGNGDFVYRMTDYVARLRNCSRNDGCTSLRTITSVARGSCQFYIGPNA